MINQLKALAVLLVLAGVLASGSLFVVEERDLAIKFQLGKIIRSDYSPGLYFKIPLLQSVKKFDRRVQTLDSEPELYLTSEKKNVKVDSFVKWRVKDVERYFTATGGNALRAASRLSTVAQKRLKDEFGKRTIREVVSGERTDMMSALSVALDEEAVPFGIQIVDVRVKRIDLPENVSNSVFQRMSAERKEVAQMFRSRGSEAAKVIRAKADREREVLLAEAQSAAEQLRGEGDGAAAEIYANAYQKDAEFYAFYRSINAYRNTFSNPSDVLVLSPEGDFFRYFSKRKGGK